MKALFNINRVITLGLLLLLGSRNSWAQLPLQNLSCIGCSPTVATGYADGATASPATAPATTYNFVSPYSTFTQCATVRTDANGTLGIINTVGTTFPQGNTTCSANTLASRKGSLYLSNGSGGCTGPEIQAVRKGAYSGTFNPEYVGLQPNTDYTIVIQTTTDASCSSYATSAVKYYGGVAPIFYFNCGTPTVTGSFIIGTSSAGTISVPITGATAATVSFTVTGTGFTGSTTTTLTAGQTSVSIPISFNGTGTAGSKTLTITSTAANGSCSATAIVTAAPGGVGNNGYLWFKADSKVYSNAGTTLAADGNNIQEWQNNFGNANVPKIQQTGLASLKPYLRGGANNLGLNFNPTIDQTSGTWMKSPSSTLTINQIAGSNTNLTVYSVFKETFGGGTQVVIADHPSNAGQPSVHILNNGLFVSDNCLNNYYSISSSSLGSSPKMFTSIWGGGSGSASNFVYDKGITTSLSDNDPTASIATTAQNYMGLGYACGTAYTATTRVNEFIVYAGNHDAATRNKVESYLAIKWGFTLGTNASTVNYTNSAGTTIWTGDATYQNNITGIGRDDISDLSQKQSKSVNTAALVAVGNGNTIATDNLSNSNTFSADKSFLLFGDDNTALAWQTTEINAGKKRVTREWKVNESGTVGSVKLQIPDDSSPLSTKLPTESASTIYLVVDTDGNFSSGATLIPMTLNGTNWEVNYNFPVGTSYFTVATESIENCTNNIDDDGDGLVDCNDPDCKPTVPRLVIRN